MIGARMSAVHASAGVGIGGSNLMLVRKGGSTCPRIITRGEELRCSAQRPHRGTPSTSASKSVRPIASLRSRSRSESYKLGPRSDVVARAPLSMGVGSGAGGREICETVRTSLKASHWASRQKTIARGCWKNWRASELTFGESGRQW